MTTAWFESNYHTKGEHEQYRPAYYATFCDGCETLLTHNKSRNIHQEKQAVKDQQVLTRFYCKRPKSYKDFRHFCNSDCEKSFKEGSTNKRIQRNIAARAHEIAKRKSSREEDWE